MIPEVFAAKGLIMEVPSWTCGDFFWSRVSSSIKLMQRWFCLVGFVGDTLGASML